MFGLQSHSGRVRPDFFSRYTLAVALLAGCTASISAEPPATAPLPRIELQVGDQSIIAEVAADDATRARGLMFRESLAANHGMLFVFPEPTQLCFWMKNTPLPLTVAFIDTQGAIVSLADMEPYSLEPHCAIAPAQYALEMEQGWFARRSHGPGTKIEGLPQVAR